jgi:hypothetical protein
MLIHWYDHELFGAWLEHLAKVEEAKVEEAKAKRTPNGLTGAASTRRRRRIVPGAPM